jgi:hypothetical protein
MEPLSLIPANLAEGLKETPSSAFLKPEQITGFEWKHVVLDTNILKIELLVDSGSGDWTTVVLPDPILTTGCYGRPGGETMSIKGVRITVSGKEFDIALPDISLLDENGLEWFLGLPVYAMGPSSWIYDQLKLVDFGQWKSESSVKSLSDTVKQNMEPLMNTKLPSPVVVAVPWEHANRFVSELESAAEKVREIHPNLATIAQVDYLAGAKYIAGKASDLPLVGGISNVLFKKLDGEDLDRGDWSKVTGDVLMVLPIVALPLAPVTGGASLAAWVGANAAFGAMSSGITDYIAKGDTDSATRNATKGALVGAVGALAGGVAAAKIAPAIANQLAANAAAGGAMGTAVSTTEATIRIIEAGEDFPTAAKEVVTAAIEGGAVGAGAGAAGFAITRIVSKLTKPIVEETVKQTSSEVSFHDAIGRVREGAYFSKQSMGHFKRFETYARQLEGIPGVKENLSKIAGNNINVARGHYTELGAAAAMKKAGHDVAAIAHKVTIPKLGNTDIDILLRDGTWIEKKIVKTIYCDLSFKTKIDKIAEALKLGLEIPLPDGSIIKIGKGIFVNSSKIHHEAIAYAKSKGVEIFEKTPYTHGGFI